MLASLHRVVRDIAGSREDHVDNRAQMSVPEPSQSYPFAIIEGTEWDAIYQERHPDRWNSRVGHGCAFFRRVVSLIAVDIPTEMLKVATEVCGILSARGDAPRFVISG